MALSPLAVPHLPYFALGGPGLPSGEQAPRPGASWELLAEWVLVGRSKQRAAGPSGPDGVEASRADTRFVGGHVGCLSYLRAAQTYSRAREYMALVALGSVCTDGWGAAGLPCGAGHLAGAPPRWDSSLCLGEPGSEAGDTLPGGALPHRKLQLDSDLCQVPQATTGRPSLGAGHRVQESGVLWPCAFPSVSGLPACAVTLFVKYLFMGLALGRSG